MAASNMLIMFKISIIYSFSYPCEIVCSNSMNIFNYCMFKKPCLLLISTTRSFVYKNGQEFLDIY